MQFTSIFAEKGDDTFSTRMSLSRLRKASAGLNGESRIDVRALATRWMSKSESR